MHKSLHIPPKGWVLGLTLLAFALRIYALGRWELWFDEAASYVVAVKSIPQLLAYTRTAIREHPPGYYLLLHFWMQAAGSSEFALRFISVLAGVLFVPLIYRFAHNLFSRNVALFAALVATISPFAISYAQEARMYTLLGLLALLSLYTFWLMLHRDGWGMWCAWVVLTLASVLTHYLFGLLVIAQNVYILLLWPKLDHRRMRWLALQGCLVVGALVWAVVAPGMIRSFFEVMHTTSFGLGSKIGKVLLEFALGGLRASPSTGIMYLTVSIPWVLAMGGLFLAWHRPKYRDSWQALILVASALFVPILVGVPILPVGVGRYFFVAFPAFCLAIALALSSLTQRRTIGAVLAAGSFVLVSIYGLHYQYTIDKGVFGQAMRLTHERYQPEEAIVLAHPYLWPPATYYARNIALPRYYVPDTLYRVSEAKIRSALQDILKRYDSIWFGPVLPARPDPGIVERNLNNMAFQSDKQWFADSTFVVHYFRLVPLKVTDTGILVWAGRIALRRYEHSSLSLPAGGALRLRFYWQRIIPLRRRYFVSLTLSDAHGRVWARRASEPCGAWCLTTDWDTKVVRDQHALLVPADTPPGRYDLWLTWYEQASGQPLEVTNAQGTDLGTSVHLATVTVTDPAPSTIPPHPPTPFRATFANGLVLRGYDLPSHVVRPGDIVPLDLYWSVDRQPSHDATLELSLLDGRGQVRATTTDILATPSYPPSHWLAGRAVRSRIRFAIPPTARTGSLHLQLALHTASGQAVSVQWQDPLKILGGLWIWHRSFRGGALPLVTLVFKDRQHNFTLPPIAYSLTATLGSQIELVGFDLQCPSPRQLPCALDSGEQLRLTLVWRAKGPTGRRYKVFTHLVGPDGKLWGQYDAEPAGGDAPTTTWVPGEVISDTHTISLDPQAPTGTYRLLVGMYHEASGQRLPASLNGKLVKDDALPIAKFKVKSK